MRPSGETSTFIQLPSSTRIGTSRVFRPRGALTFQAGGFFGVATATGAVGATGGGGNVPVFSGTGAIALFSGPWVCSTGLFTGGGEV